LETCAILTVPASPPVRGVHHRMPIILPPQDYAAWLGEEEVSPRKLFSSLTPITDGYEITPVSKAVGNVRFEGEECIKPLLKETPEKPLSLF